MVDLYRKILYDSGINYQNTAMKTHILSSEQLVNVFEVFGHPDMDRNDMNFFRQDMRNWYHNPEHVYFVISEHMEFRYSYGENFDGSKAYSDFCGDFPIAVLKLYSEDAGFFIHCPTFKSQINIKGKVIKNPPTDAD